MQRRFANATECVPVPAQVAGLRLRPFCLGHHLLFRRLALPFAVGPDAKASQDELLLAVAICSRSYEETLGLLMDGEWHHLIDEWQRKLTGAWIKRKIDPQRLERLFRDYLRDGYRHPPVWRREAGGRGMEMSAPWEQLLKCRLLMAGFSETDVLNGYLPGRWYDYYTVIELNAAQNCTDTKHWRRIFVTESDAIGMSKHDGTEPKG